MTADQHDKQVEQQEEYRRSIATGGLVALLSPYASVVPDRDGAPASGHPVAV